MGPSEAWSMDLVSDQTACDKRLRALTSSLESAWPSSPVGIWAAKTWSACSADSFVVGVRPNRLRQRKRVRRPKRGILGVR